MDHTRQEWKRFFRGAKGDNGGDPFAERKATMEDVLSQSKTAMEEIRSHGESRFFGPLHRSPEYALDILIVNGRADASLDPLMPN